MTAAGDKIQAAEPDDVERLMTRKEREGKKLPLPGPMPPIKMKPKASNKDIERDFDTFEYEALVVEPHTTRAGFLFYDVSQLDHPLRGAKLHLHKLRDADGNELFYFEIPFDKYLQSKSSRDELAPSRAPPLLVVSCGRRVGLPDRAVLHAHAAARSSRQAARWSGRRNTWRYSQPRDSAR